MHEHSVGNKRGTSSDNQKYLILVGNPNVGKSVIFSHFTKKYATVSNYPGTTVEISQGIYKKNAEGNTIVCIDTPGMNSLLPSSEDEKVSRDILLKTKLENNLQCIVQIADAKNLERALIITLQLLLLNVPLILVLNMMDEVENSNLKINLNKLQNLLGIPVIPTVATQNKGLNKIENNIMDTNIYLKKELLPKIFLEKLNLLKNIFSHNPLAEFFAFSLLAGDKTINEWIAKQYSFSELQDIENLQENVFSNLTKNETGENFENYFVNSLIKKANSITQLVTQKMICRKNLKY